MSELVPDTTFDPAGLTDLPEPVRRYFTHAIRPGASLVQGARLSMRGHIKAGTWLPFTAEEDLDGCSFDWRARVVVGPVTLLTVRDRFRDGAGDTTGLLFGRRRLFHADDGDTTRSAAGRAAVESFWCPQSLLPSQGVEWRAERDDLIVAKLSLPPEHPELRLVIDAAGAVRAVSILRWGNASRKKHGYIPCGGQVEAEARFGNLTLPSQLTVGWWFGTPRYSPFFKATITNVTAGPPSPPGRG